MAAAHRNTTTSWDITTDAGWRAWGAAVKASLVAAGMVQTADTGQVDWTTSTTPVAEVTAGASATVYEIWRFPSSAEQTANPIFFRLGYVRGDTAAVSRIFFQVGKGSNGTGGLTTAISSGTDSLTDAVDSASRIIHCAYRDGCLVFYGSGDISSSNGTGTSSLIIERLRNDAGNFDGTILAYRSTAAATGRACYYNGTSWVEDQGLAIVSRGFRAVAGRVPLGRLFVEGHEGMPIRSLMFAATSGVYSGPDHDNTGVVQLELDADWELRAVRAAAGGWAAFTQHIANPALVGSSSVISATEMTSLVLNEIT